MQETIQRGKETRDALYEMRERLDLALTSANMGVWSWDLKKDTIIWDSRLYRIFGLLPKTDQLSLNAILNFIHPDDRDMVEKQINETLIPEKKPEKKFETGYRIIWPDHSIHYLSAMGKAYFNEEDKPIKMMGICWDVTERYQTEAYLRQQQQQLSQVAKISSMGEVASALAHELNQPLSAIALYTETALLRLLEGNYSAEELIFSLKKATDMIERAGSIIHRMKNISNQIRLYHQKENLGQVIDESVELIKNEILENNVKMEVKVDAEISHLNIDKVQIQQVIVNLIRNSIEAMRDKNSTNRIMQIIAEVVENRVQIIFKDNGPGFAEDTINKLFDAYFTTKSYGMGMGLSICRNIIQLHGGRLVAENSKSGGAVIQISLPLL